MEQQVKRWLIKEGAFAKFVVTQWLDSRNSDPKWIKQISAQYAQAKPYPHILINEFLHAKKHAELLDALQSQQFFRKESDLYSFAQTEPLVESEDKQIKSFISYLQSEEFLNWASELTGHHLRGTVELFGALYQDTDYLLCHDDQLENRKIAFVYYLTTLDAQEGGGLTLYDDVKGHPKNRVVTYTPQANSAILFTVSEKSWHEVDEVKGANRASIGGWLHE